MARHKIMLSIVNKIVKSRATGLFESVVKKGNNLLIKYTLVLFLKPFHVNLLLK
jgi:hypothetical protein